MYERDEVNRTWKIDDDGERTLLANFVAEIVTETRYLNGQDTQTVLGITGRSGTEKELIEFSEVQVKATEFPSLAWVVPAWGVRALIQPGSGIKEDLRTAIQAASAPKVKTIYRHVGWSKIGGKRVYLHNGGGIGEKGNDPSITVELPEELSRYDLSGADLVAEEKAVVATFDLLELTKPAITWPLLAATFAPLFGPVDFALHVSGRTGTFKSELLSLFASHYGPRMDARHLPGSWSSTANALEAQAFFVANAPFVIDDFVPSGTAYQVRQYQQTAEKIIRSQGNQSGRARLTDASSLQTTMYPRGVILSTGEDCPEGHSIRARMLILEMTPTDITAERLTLAQRQRELFVGTTAALIRELAKKPYDITARARELRDGYRQIGHNRTPSMLGHLQAAGEAFIRWAGNRKHLTPKMQEAYNAQLAKAIQEVGQAQAQYLETADPCMVFLGQLRQMLGAGTAHLRTQNGGIPASPTLCGWTEEGNSDVPQYRSHGPCIGWVSWNEDELYIDATLGVAAIRKAASHEITTTPQTLMLRLKDGGHLKRREEERRRCTVRIVAENHPRTVLCLSVGAVLQVEREEE